PPAAPVVTDVMCIVRRWRAIEVVHENDRVRSRRPEQVEGNSFLGRRVDSPSPGTHSYILPMTRPRYRFARDVRRTLWRPTEISTNRAATGHLPARRRST